MGEPFLFAWWNTKLAVKARRKARTERKVKEETWIIATTVIRELASRGVGVVALGEVLPTSLERLRVDTPFEVASDARIDVQSGIGVLYNPSLADVQFAANIGSPLRNREVNRSLIFGVNITSGAPPIRLIVSHWPAHGQEEYADTRLALGGDLRTNITNWSDLHGDQAFAIMCGDFNDDPFDKSISAALFSTRDRELARNQPRALYNPFWRLLGERKPFEMAAPQTGAGTCRWSSGTHSKWHTFDQFMFTSTFLGGGAWELVEAATEVWDNPPIVNESGRMHSDFDHYPIIAGIRSGLDERLT